MIDFRYSMLFAKPEEQVDVTRVFSLISRPREEIIKERKSPWKQGPEDGRILMQEVHCLLNFFG